MKEIELRKLIREEIRIVLNEKLLNEGLLEEEALEEGKLANWFLGGLLTLASVAGIGQTSRVGTAQDLANAEKLSQMIKNNPEQFNKILTQADFKVNDENLKKLKKVDADDIQVLKTKSLKQAQSALKSGKYALSSIETKADTIKKVKKGTPIVMKNSLDLKYGGQAFETGKFELNNEVKASLKSAIDSILEMNGKITKIYIESSTDQQRMVDFVSKSDPTGNITLAKKRSEGLSNYIKTLTDVTPTLGDPDGDGSPGIANNLKGGVKADQFKKADIKAKETGDRSELDALQKQAQPSRYNRVVIDFEVSPPAPGDSTVYEIVKKDVYELITKRQKPKQVTGGKKGSFFDFDFKCKGLSVDGKAVQCPAFQGVK